MATFADFADTLPDPNSSVEFQGKVALAILRTRQYAKEHAELLQAGKRTLAKIGSTDKSTGAELLIDTWRKVSKPRQESSVAKMRLYAKRFQDHIGVDLRNVTRATRHRVS